MSWTNIVKHTGTWLNNTLHLLGKFFLLKEDGFYLLQENGGKLILEDSHYWSNESLNTGVWNNETKHI